MRLNSSLSRYLLLCLAALGVSLGVLACAPADQPQEEVEAWSLEGAAVSVESARGVVVSGHPLASGVGARVLEAGGNAIDAAVAVGFALAAVLPEAGNIGGGGFLVYRPAAEGPVETLDFREKAPAAAFRDMYLDENGEPTDRSVIGHLASGVPGSVAGLWAMHQRHGTLDWAELVEPSVELARGHVMDAVRHRNLGNNAERLARFPASASQFLPNGEPPPIGEVWQQPDLARTLERIRDQGPDGFYRGETAALLVAEMERGGGIISAVDLADYQPVWREPIEIEYRDHTMYSMPPPSSGGVTLAMILNILEGFDLGAASDAERIHLETEAMRRAFIDRNRHLADPDFVDLPVERLQSQEYADQLRSEIDPQRASATPKDFVPVAESSQTTHYSIVDAAGNAAAITTTINGSFGSKVTVEGAGFLLNNEMDDFAAAPGRPNQFGLVEGENNAVAPHKRMLSSMTPSVVVDPSGELLMVVGSPGGPTIITSVFRTISGVIDRGQTLAEAVEEPRSHHQALPDQIAFEKNGLSADTVSALEGMGHSLRERSGFSGDVNAIVRSQAGYIGVADPRRGSGAAAASSEGASELREAAGS